jgi:hypothetical protein
MRNRTAVFLINLVQDVNIVRPLVFMATRDFGLNALLLVSTYSISGDPNCAKFASKPARGSSISPTIGKRTAICTVKA